MNTPTPFKASVGQGYNVTFDWLFDNETMYTYTAHPSMCTQTCKQSIVVSLLQYIFVKLGVVTLMKYWLRLPYRECLHVNRFRLILVMKRKS